MAIPVAANGAITATSAVTADDDFRGYRASNRSVVQKVFASTGERFGMRYGIEDIGSSPVATALFVIGVGFAAFALLFGSGSGGYGAPQGSLRWWLGIAGATVAVVLIVAEQLR